MPDASSIAGIIAQRMAQKQEAPKPDQSATPGEGSTTLTPEYVKANQDSIQKAAPYNPNMDYNSKLRAFFGLGK